MRLIGVGKAPALGIALDRSAVDFLQKDNVGTGLRNSIAHGVQHKTPVATAVSLVDVIREYVNFACHTCSVARLVVSLWALALVLVCLDRANCPRPHVIHAADYAERNNQLSADDKTPLGNVGNYLCQQYQHAE